MSDKESRDKTIHIAASTHKEAKEFCKKNGWNFGMYCDKAIAEKTQKEKSKTK